MKNKTLKKRLVLKKKFKILFTKILLTIIIFLIGMIALKKEPAFKKKILENVYEKSFKFTKIKSIYEKYFGNILSVDKIIAKEEPVFNEKLVYEKITPYKNGIELSVNKNYLVPIIESGIVVYIGTKEDYGPTITIEQIDGTTTSYSNIDSKNIKLYDYLEKGKLLGEATSNKIYLVFQKDGQYLDYKKYI